MKKATTLYLVRHAEVQNPDDIFSGRMPGFRLTKKGESQATKLAERLASYPISTIYTSPLERARQTAGYLAARRPQIPVVYDDRLLEIRTPLEGMKFDLLRKGNLNFYSDALIAQGGEKLDEIWRRMKSFLDDVRNTHAGGVVVAFSHGDPIMITKAVIQGKPLELDSIRTGEYVSHASGFNITLSGGKYTIKDISF